MALDRASREPTAPEAAAADSRRVVETVDENTSEGLSTKAEPESSEDITFEELQALAAEEEVKYLALKADMAATEGPAQDAASLGGNEARDLDPGVQSDSSLPREAPSEDLRDTADRVATSSTTDFSDSEGLSSNREREAAEDISLDELQRLADEEESKHAEGKSSEAASVNQSQLSDSSRDPGGTEADDADGITFEELQALAAEEEVKYLALKADKADTEGPAGDAASPGGNEVRDLDPGVLSDTSVPREVPSEDLRDTTDRVATSSVTDVLAEQSTEVSTDVMNAVDAHSGAGRTENDGHSRNPVGSPDASSGSGNLDISGAGDAPESIIEVTPPSMSQDYYTNIPPAVHERYLVRNPDARVPIFDGPPLRDQAIQGQVGDCGIIATLGAVAGCRPDAIRTSITEVDDGKFEVVLYETDGSGHVTGETRAYQVDDTLPVDVSDPDRPAAGAEADMVGWAAILEKVVAADDQAWDPGEQSSWQSEWDNGLRNGGARYWVDKDRMSNGLPASPDAAPLGYNRIDLGSTSYQQADLIARLTGLDAEVRVLPGGPRSEELTIREFRDCIDQQKPIVVGTRGRASGELFPPGVEPGHAYEVYQVDQDRIQLRNPWGVDHPAPMSAAEFRNYYLSEYATLK